jgi:ribose 5-phosphate isomerase B
MRIALASDEPHGSHATIKSFLEERGHTVVPFGACESGHEQPWATVAEHAALAISEGACDEGIFLCWSGTGISMAANKVAGIRAALCTDAEMARAARVWNHANVLCLSNRLLADMPVKELLSAWLDTAEGDEGNEGVALLADVDARNRGDDFVASQRTEAEARPVLQEAPRRN